MAAGGNQGFGAEILPNPAAGQMQTLQMLQQRAFQQQQFQAAQDNRELLRKQHLSEFMGKEFNDKNYGTMTAMDPVLSNMVAQSRQKFAKIIHDNPNMDEADLEGQMQGDIARISDLSEKVKAGKAQIDQQLKDRKDLAGIDVGALQQGALKNLLYQGGNTVISDPSKIDLSKDYIDEELQNRGNLYVQGDQPLMSTIESYKPQKGGDTKIGENKGVTTEDKYTSSLYPWESLQHNNNGNVTGKAVNSVPATLKDGTVVADPTTGKPMQVVDPATMQKFATLGNAANIKRDTDEFIRSHGMDPSKWQPGTEAYNILARHVLYNKLSELTPSELQLEHKKTDASVVTKMQLGIVDALGRTVTKADERREAELLGTRNAKIRQAANLDPTVIQAGVPTTIEGHNLIDITDPVGGFETLADKKSGPTDIDPKTGAKLPDFKAISKVLVDPAQAGKIFTLEGPEGHQHLVEYSGKDIDALLTRHAPANGYKSLNDVNEINKKIPIVTPQVKAKTADDLGKKYGF